VLGLPRLQLNLAPSSWNAPTHRRTGVTEGQVIRGALKSTSEGKGRTVALVLSTDGVETTSKDALLVRGHPAETVEAGNVITIRWRETPNITATLIATNLTKAEAVTLATRSIADVSDSDWAIIVRDAVEALPPDPWERVVNGQF
jgi:hypothetical protein